MKKNIKFLGIDIGGAHIKIVGLNDEKKINFVDYKKFYLWKEKKKITRIIQYINSISSKITLCGITMTGELCDVFENRHLGAQFIFQNCENLKMKKKFYTISKNIFTKKLHTKNIISMNWHAVARFISKKIKNAIIIDFGSTTTDISIIKDHKIKNQNFDDFSRLNNHELLYTGFTRTPIIGITDRLIFNKKKISIIPEFFSNTSDLYRIKKQLKKKIDIDETSDQRGKSIKLSKERLARNLGFDYNNKRSKLISSICNELIKIQLQKILNYINHNKLKFKLKTSTPLFVCGIGQDVLIDYLDLHKKKVYSLQKFFDSGKTRIGKEATFHAPALALALLLTRQNS